MPIELQAKLLRVLETGTFTRVGGEEQLSVDVRIIAASNRNLQEAIEKNTLREDLYYRLKVFQLCLPSLRERPEDVSLLAQWFLDEFTRVEGIRKGFSDAALQTLREYRWPGNVRELRNVVQSAHILAGRVIDVDSLPVEMRTPNGHSPREGNVMTVRVGTPIADVERNLIMATLRQCDGNKARAAELLGVSLKTLYNRLGAYRAGAATDEVTNLESEA
jgi:DNA-binding NtrC family response regulator